MEEISRWENRFQYTENVLCANTCGLHALQEPLPCQTEGTIPIFKYYRQSTHVVLDCGPLQAAAARVSQGACTVV